MDAGGGSLRETRTRCDLEERDLEPFYFGPRHEELFGVYHPAKDPLSRKAVLLCGPVFAEYSRTYAALRKAAERWVGRGLHALRFDYFGTGDSAGTWQEGGPTRWLKDIKSAAAELKEISGADRIMLAGVRFGGTLASNAVSDTSGCDELALWDPVLDGAQYLQQLQKTHRELIDEHRNLSRTERQIASHELAGFSEAAWITDELAQVCLQASDIGLERVHYVVSSGDFLSDRHVQDWKSAGVSVRETLVPFDCNWSTFEEQAMTPHDILEAWAQCG